METKARILIIDDNYDLCENIKDVLVGKDYFAECAVNGNEAINLAGKNSYDIALVDIKLPDISGNEVVEKIAEISPSTDCIYMTGNATINSAIKAVKQEHVVSYEIKPLDLNHLLNVINQVMERRKAEEELRKYGILFDNISDLAYICDTGGNVLYLNSIFEKFSGHKPEEFIGKSFAPLFDGEELKKAMDFYSRTLKGESSQQEVYFKDTGVLCEYNGLPLRDEKREIVGVIGTARDITERRQMEEAILQSEKLRSLGIITAGISHEFNNILAIISGNAQLLEESLKDDEELVEVVRTIRRATNDGAEISGKMLKFTKTAKKMAGLVPIDINELINQAIDFTKPGWKNMAQAKGINYSMDTEGLKRVPSILSNSTELREVFVNIIHNALDAMPDDGRVTFRAWSGEDSVFISISDTGKGMSEELMKNIFDPFFTTRTPSGTGLGLSTVYGIVTRHRGIIEVESKVGRGSTFTLQFPIATKADSPKESPEPEQEIKCNSLRILVVDDEEDICNLLNKFLVSSSFIATTSNALS